MGANSGIWENLTRLLRLLVLGGLIIFLALQFKPVIERNRRMYRQLLQLEAEKRELDEERRQLELMLRSLTRDPKTIERLARERLGYSRPGETVIKFQAPTNTTGSNRPAY